MNNCVSKNSADFKSLYKEVFGIDNIDAGLEQILAAKISSWQDENGLDKWPLASDMQAAMASPATMAYITDKTSGKGLIKPGVAELFESNPELANAVYEALGFNDVSSEKISNELKDILTPKEDVYNRELYFSGVFQTNDEYDDTVNKKLEPFLLPIIKKHVKQLMIDADVHPSDIKIYNEKIDKANTIEELPNIEYFNKWGLTNKEKSWTNLYYDRQFIINIIYSNIENLPLDILFKDDIVKKNGKYYAKIKKFETNKDTTGNYDKVSSWHKSSRYPSKYYDYTIRAKFKPQDVGFGKYTYKSGYDNDYYSKMYIPEYIINKEVEIDTHDTFSKNKKRLNNEGEINVWFNTAENIEDTDNAIINDAYQQDPLFDEVTKYFNLRKNNQITPEQKQQAQQLYSSYLQTTNNPTIEGFKQWNNKQQQINELFESNPELANAVYEALGFDKQINEIADTKKVDEFIEKYKEALPNIKNGKTLISHLQTISNRNTGTTKQFADLIIKLSQQNKSLEELLNNPNLYAKPDGIGDEGAFHWSLSNNLSVNKIVLELNHFKTNTYDDVFLHELIHNLTTQFIVKDSDLFNQDFYNKVKELYSVFDNHLDKNRKVDKQLIEYWQKDIKKKQELLEIIKSKTNEELIKYVKSDGKKYSDNKDRFQIESDTWNFYVSDFKDIKDVKAALILKVEDVIADIQKRYNELEIEKGKKDYYYFNSSSFKKRGEDAVLSEFLATFMNNAKFRELLKNIEYKNNKSLFQKIIDLIGEFLGLTKNESLYNEFVLTLTKFINDNDYSNVAKQTVKTAYENTINLLEQQKQQAQQLYSQYLDTIFPDSKVKDIVYHGTTLRNLQSIIEKGFSKDKQRNTGFHIGSKEAANNAVISIRPAENRRIVPVIINSKNIERTTDTKLVDKEGDLEWQNKIQKAKGDSFVYENNREDNGNVSYVVFEPEQIHILGTKQDIEGFKEFADAINQKQNTLPSREYQSDFFKGLDPYQQEAKEILYDFYKENITNPNDSRIGFYNEQLRKLSESVGDEQWYLRLSKNNKWYVAGYKNGSVTHPDYFSIYAEQRYTAWNRSRYYEEFNRKHSIGAAKNKIRSVIYSNKVNALLDNIQQAFPGLPIIRETKETTKAKGHNSMLPGWMDADGYHINMDNIHPGVFVHEIAHMFRAILKTVNPTAYKELERKLDDYISENPNWYEAYLRKHPNQSDDVTRDEILAIIAGSVSEDKIAHFLADNDVEPTNTEIKTFRQRVKEIFDAFWSAIRDFFSSHYGTTAFDGDLSNMTLEELYMGITDDIIAGREIRHISPKDMEIISYEYQESGRTFQESPKNNLDGKVNVIENVGDIPNIIINNPNRNVITDSNNDAANNPELFVNAVFMRRQTLLNNTGSITWLGKRFDYENLTDDQIKTLIRTEILPYHLNVQERFIDDIRSAIELVQEGNDISYAITKTFIEDSNEEYEDKKRSYIKVNELQKLLTLIGAMDNIKDVLSLSEFMSKYSNLGLVDPRMVGLDPLVIVHENTDKSISISISDITAADLSSQGKFTGSRNKLNGRFVNNVSNMFDMDSSKITWSNNKRDARAAALTFTLASMNAMAKKNNIHLDIRRAGVFGMQGGVAGHIYSRTIHDYQDAFDQVKELFTIPEMRGLVSDNATSIIETLNNDQAWDAKDLYCDHIFELRSYYNSQATINNIPDWYRDDLLGINMSKKKHIEVLRARQKQIETQRASIRATAETDYEYQAIAKAIYWYNQGVHVNNMSIDDISSGLMKRVINPHNLGNGIVDYATIQFEAAKSMVVNKANLFTDELSKYIKASMKSHGKELIMENIISMNPASEIFDRLFPKIEAIVDKPYEIRGKKYNTGDKVTVSLSNEIYCSAHPNIKKALEMKDAKGNALLTKEDVALADFIVKTVREQYVEALLNRNRYNKKYTIEDAIEELDEVYLPYTLPVIRATQEQNIRAGAIKTFFGRFLDKMVNQGINWGDLTSTEFSEINDRFFHQRSYTKQLEAMGLELVNGEYRVNNLESLFNISNNLEYTMKIFVMDSERKRIYDDHVTPILNDCFAIANYADKTLNKPQDNTIEFLREYYNLIALHKRKDDYMPQGIVKSIAPVVRTALQLHTFISIAYRPLIWIKSAYFNESAQWLYGIANSAANWGITTGEKLNMPGADHMAKAHKLLFGSKADYKKIWKLANKMQLINGNERDVLENVFSNIADKHLFKQQLAHLGNWYTDAAARALTMVSYMLFDGSYDAHIYNPKTGELTYDVTKDERFYKNGKKIEGWDLVHDRIVEKQTTQGLITDGKQQIGYDFEEINKRIKWYADKFIIGSMDIHQKALLGNQFAGAAVGQFRGFSIDKIWNDIAIGKIKSTYGGRLVPYKDENGEWVTVEEQIEMESNLQSLIGYLWDFRKLTKGINNWKEDSSWNNLSPIRRRNLINVTVRLVVMGAIIMAIKALRMSDRDRRKVEWLFSELFMYDTMENIFDNPVPVISSIEDMYKIILGKKRFAKIYRYMGPVNDAVWFYELASSNDEVAKHEKTERQKAKEKKEREEKKELEKLKKQKALEKYGFIPDEYK